MKRNKKNKTNIEFVEVENIPHNSQESNVITSDYHTLITNVKPSRMIPIEGSNLLEQEEEYTIHKLYVGEFFDDSYHGWNKIINRLQEADHQDQLEIHIASYGGSVRETIQLNNLINSMYSSRCTTYLNHGYSGGAMTFMMGQERIIYKHSDIMFHFFSGGERGKGSDMLNSLQHSIKTIDHFYRDMLDSFFTKEELDAMVQDGKEFWMDADTMMKRGIATGIIIDGKYYEAEDYEKKFENGKLKEEVLKAEIEEGKKHQKLAELKDKFYAEAEEKVKKNFEKLFPEEAEAEEAEEA